jgi:hypothetical protein
LQLQMQLVPLRPGFVAHEARESAIQLREAREKHERMADDQAPPAMAQVCRGWRRAMTEAPDVFAPAVCATDIAARGAEAREREIQSQAKPHALCFDMRRVKRDPSSWRALYQAPPAALRCLGGGARPVTRQPLNP